MRLHRVEVQAFGPFAGRESVDVDALGEHGLFLLHGPTGAGKTSVLDAVCFALYGAVPGARAGTGRLRSDHAPAGLPPEVVVEVSIGSRRLEVTRAPAWERPKKRGTGTTTEQARTVLRELVGGLWQPLTSRNDEASQLLTDLLGMGLEQFTKVVLLPQGEFAAFLRAPAEKRLPLLQRLFGTDRFADVETWLADRRRHLARQVEQADAAVDRLLARVDQAVGSLAADAPDTDTDTDDQTSDPQTSDPRTSDPQDGADPESTAAAALARSSRELARRRGLEESTAAAAAAARLLVQSLAERARRAERWTQLCAERDELLADVESVRADQLRLDRARAAASVAGDLRAARSAVTDLDRARSALAAASAAQPLRDLHPVGDGLGDLVASTRQELGRLADLLQVQSDLEALEGRRADLDARLVRARARAEDSGRERDAAAAACAQHRLALEDLGDADTERALAQRRLSDAQACHDAARRAGELARDAESRQDQLRVATDAAQQARQVWLDLRERRLAGMASELARDLVDGEPCAVCGSATHPGPATAAATTVTAEQEQRAHAAADDAALARAGQEAALASVRERLAQVQASTGGLDEPRARAAHQDATDQLAAATARAERLEDHRTAVSDQTRRHDTAAARCAEATASASALAAEHAEVSRSAESLRQRLHTALEQDVSVGAKITRLRAQASALEALQTAQAAVATATAGVRDTAARAHEAATLAGFGSVQDAAAAALAPHESAVLEARVRSHTERLAAVRSQLTEEEMRLASAEADERAGTGSVGLGQELAAAQQELDHCQRQAQVAAAGAAVAQQATTALAVLAEHVAAEVAAADPVRAEHALVSDLAACAGGTGGSNALRMRLSSFVLAARLEQVAAAATVRLHGMSGGRYALAHTDAVERGGRRSGLGLQVVDAWTGRHRDTASLSGGESFLASLALALGLADVVQAESGGTAIETLFVDEGFGTLDPESLEEVMAVLDGLRDGGRRVGVVSHVQELRQRIPARLEVVKTRTGSHLRVEQDAA